MVIESLLSLCRQLGQFSSCDACVRAWRRAGGRLPAFAGWLLTFVFVAVTWVFFRASSLEAALDYFKAMFSGARWDTTMTPLIAVLLALGALTQFIPAGWYGALEARYAVTIDVPQIDEGLKFYRDALGLTEVARPFPSYVILKCGAATVGLMEKAAGSKPAKGSDDVRRYERHWTPVHIDFHVEDFDGVLAKALSAGAICESSGGRPVALIGQIGLSRYVIASIV